MGDTNDVKLSVLSEALCSSEFTNQLELCLQALWCGANVNINLKGYTPLICAILNGTPEVVRLLLYCKANTDIEIPDDAVVKARVRPMAKVVKALIEAKVDP